MQKSINIDSAETQCSCCSLVTTHHNNNNKNQNIVMTQNIKWANLMPMTIFCPSIDGLYSPSHGSKNIIIIIIMIKNSIEIKNNINNTSANMLKTVQRRGNCINYICFSCITFAIINFLVTATSCSSSRNSVEWTTDFGLHHLRP